MLRTRIAIPRGIGRVRPLAPRPVANLRVRCQATTGGDQQPSVAPAVEVTAPPVVAPVAPIPETTATYVMPPNPMYYQGMPAPRQDYYMAAPPAAYYPPPPAPYKEEPASSGAPWWIWLGLGVILGQVLAKVQEYMKNPKTPQQIMMEMAMKQMSGAMGSTTGAGMPPFGGAASPFGGPAGGAANPFANFAAAASAAPAATVDTTASAVQAGAFTPSPPSSSSSTNGEVRKGEKFASRLSSEGREPRKVELPQASKPLDVVEPVVKEPSTSSSSSTNSSSAGASKPRSSFFADVDMDATVTSTSASSSAAADGNSAVMSEMMESMLRNPEMQKMLYPYLPEPMRNPQSIEWMLSNPEVKKQMEQMFAQQPWLFPLDAIGNVMSPQMMDMMKNMDFNQEKVNRQFAELGLKPEDVISKVMSNPELAAGFSNPKVQAAIIDISSNPMNIVKYQTDPEIMKVLEKVTEIFQPQMNQK
ncbi:hypothetical protein VOLCADRAFT_103770 [Volvox carteri f. nagariensis]|uniref:Protein TIC 40, chloroplastic n=1 Tax=Volvox carteri f. nagariensis TaxID=3068 RepID=D8TP24_VOLCA|nr:uncharacterized protein VOLCADRAFT_103770 [Volvox carteri f. nagariensis]EFJ50547.1 hypothetical protein VOLCADRAFT_103770 [Volvox carteri f. nagariensis]|eukprot:XP_002948140.1 hypothetical protein VOLCADRAFT_103770 [Volvox carteri f. nagariensis]